MKKVLLGLLAIILLVGVIGCAQPASAEVLKSDKPHITSPVVGASDMAALAAGNGEFAFDLYQLLKEEDGNIFYSPYSISLALAMTYGGAKGYTAAQMADTMHYLLSQSALHPAFNNLGIELAKRGANAKGKDDKGFRLNIVNAIWGQKDYKFLADYLDLLAENYGAGLRVLDFIKDSDKSREVINKWVSDQTEGRIKDLLPEGSINPLTRLVLTNAIYFNAAWQSQFRKEMTADGAFHLVTGSDVTVPMMKQSQTFGYAKTGDIIAVELPYDGGELSMVILTNGSGSFSDFQAKLDYTAVKAVLDSLKKTRVDISMPKFGIESEFGLKETLQKMGMVKPFQDTADFTGISQESDLHIDDVVHKAFVAVDEAGTEAAAATGVIVGTTSMPLDPVALTLDHPFVFLIRDIQTGAILFIGQVMNPAL
jgi:serpin B